MISFEAMKAGRKRLWLRDADIVGSIRPILLLLAVGIANLIALHTTFAQLRPTALPVPGLTREQQYAFEQGGIAFSRIYGTAEVVEHDLGNGPQPLIRITPTTSWSWNLEGRPFTHETDMSSIKLQRTVHEPPAGD